MTISFDPDSVRMDLIGPTYDLALGYLNPATNTVRMVGYVVTPSGQWTENTDMQDENHLVQIASPASSDKFTRFPKVSQGDWSGGERQLIFINANQYYQSTQLNTTLPGHLTCNGSYATVTIANGITPILSGFQPARVVAASLRRVYFLGDNAGTYYVSVYNLGTGNVGTAAATGMGVLHEVMRNSDYPVYIGAASGMWTGSGAGTTVTLTPQVTNDNVALINGASMATFQGSVYYITGASTPNKINSATYPLPGAGAGTTVFTVEQMENLVQVLSRGATGLVFITGSGTGVDQYVYAFDGVNANFLGRIEGTILDACEANGTVYILTAAVQGVADVLTVSLPVIYSVAGSTLSIFDDFRKVDPAFWPITSAPGGHIESDGTYLWLFYAGLSTKRYILSTSAVSDVGNPLCVGAASTGRSGTPLGDGGFVETEPTTSFTTAYINTPQDGDNADGIMVTSWYDMGTPDVDKSFKSIEFAFNNAFTASSVTVSYEIDNPNAGWAAMTVMLSASEENLVAYFPVGTIGKRVRYQITLAHALAPDIQSYSTLATLGRIWAFPVACRRNPHTRTGDDQQGLLAINLLENIINAYTVAGGNVILWVPDPTADPSNPSVDPITGENVIGVSQVAAVLQDYSWTTAAGIAPGWKQAQDGGAWDMEGDVQLTLAESVS